MKTYLKMKNPITLTDCLHNCDRVCVSTFENSTLAQGTPGQIYGRGILNGATAAVMAITGKSFQDALEEVRNRLSRNTQFDPACVPEPWREDWTTGTLKQGHSEIS
jgi:hypothetical protein